MKAIQAGLYGLFVAVAQIRTALRYMRAFPLPDNQSLETVFKSSISHVTQ